MAFPLDGGRTLRERLLSRMSGGGSVEFMAPFGLSLPNRMDDTSALASHLRELVSGGQLDLGAGFEGEGADAAFADPMGGNPAAVMRARLMAALQARRGGPDRVGQPVPRHGAQRMAPRRVRRSDVRPARASARRSRRPSNYRISAPRSNRVLIRNRGRAQNRAAVVRGRGRRQIPMGIRRAESARGTNPSLRRSQGGMRPNRLFAV